MPALHHLELWTHDLPRAERAWGWLLTQLGWTARPVSSGWPLGRVWEHPDGTYLVIEDSADGTGELSRRTDPGMNHVALPVPGPDAAAARRQLDQLREVAPRFGWTELFGADYPHAGGADHVALYLVDGDQIEVELVANWPDPALG